MSLTLEQQAALGNKLREWFPHYRDALELIRDASRDIALFFAPQSGFYQDMPSAGQPEGSAHAARSPNFIQEAFDEARAENTGDEIFVRREPIDQKPPMVSGNVVEPGTFDLREWIGTRTGHWLTYDQCSEVIAHIREAQPATMPSSSDGGELAALGRWAYRVTFHGTGHNEGDPASKTLTGDEFLALIPKAPQGWKLVPREPTDAMFRAFNRTRPIPREEWQAMWDAAPSPGGSE